MNKESVEIINRLRAILQYSWVNELPDNEKIAINFNKSELKLILNCILKKDQRLLELIVVYLVMILFVHIVQVC